MKTMFPERNYTKMKPSKNEDLEKCPECGRVGLRKKYENGDCVFVHIGEMYTTGFFWKDFCYINKKEMK